MNQFSNFYKEAVSTFINENLDQEIYNNKNIIEKLLKFENGLYDDMIEFLDEQLSTLLNDEFNIEL